jgi:hypothetical protein
MDADYFRNLAKRCFAATQHCMDLHAKEEFRSRGDELTRKADELGGRIPPRIVFTRQPKPNTEDTPT